MRRTTESNHVRGEETKTNTKKEGSRGPAPGAYCCSSRVLPYFINLIASTAFALAVSMLPALHAASASWTSFTGSLPDDLAPASVRGACTSWLDERGA